jgi:hypothetical protein
MKSVNLDPLPAEKTTLNGLPRPRPPGPPLKSERGIQAITALRKLHPPVDLLPGTEATFSEKAALTKLRCLQWLHIAKHFYADPPVTLSQPVPLRNLPPIPFLTLLIEWIDDYAKITGRQRIKAPTWRRNALQGFVHRNRRLKTRRFLLEISRLATSIAAHFSNPPFDNPLLRAWGDWHRFAQSDRPPVPIDSDTVERARQADLLFTVLRRFAKDRKVSADDYAPLAPFVSDNFRRPSFIDALHDETERQSFSEYVAYAAAMDVYLQHIRLMEKIAIFRGYLDEVMQWALRVDEPSIVSKFDVICWRFCAHSAFKLQKCRKKACSLPHTKYAR